MNTSYNLKTNAEYSYYQNLVKSENSTRIVTLSLSLVFLCFAVLFIIIFIMKMKKYNKLVEEDDALLYQKKQAEAQKAQAEANATYESHNRYCKYCGCKIDSDSNSCPSCGARITK